MNHKPTYLDAAADLRRCIYASLSEKEFEDPNVKEFLDHALMILEKIKNNVDKKTFKLIKKQLKKAQDFKNDSQKRRENLLMAVLLCQTSVFSTHPRL